MSKFGRFRSELTASLAPLSGVLVPIATISAVLNVLMLGGSFFMLLVYDDVIPSRSVPTLIGLLGIITTVYVFQSLLDLIRGRAMIQVGALVDQRLSPRLFDIMAGFELRHGPLSSGSQPIRDLDAVRNYLSSQGPLALLDLPWVILFIGVLFIFHWTLGLVTIFGCIVLFGLTLAADRTTRTQTAQVTSVAASRYALGEAVRRNSEVLHALGMAGRTRASWNEISLDYLSETDKLAELSGRMQSISKTFRMLLQSIVLAVGAALVIGGYATGGIIIAGSILSARALAPIEQTIASWKSLIAMRQAWARLGAMLDRVPERIEPMQLPAPQHTLKLQNVVVAPPGTQTVTLGDVSFQARSGDVIAVIGQSGSGKSTLVRAIVGIWAPLRGTVRLDGASLDQWNPDILGRHIGYVPQSIELLDGTIAQNIARFEPDANVDDIIAAARAADVHDLIVRLSDGYEHRLGSSGGNLSAGQKQRIALARALYRDPFLLVFDEPNSNLDADGEAALGRAIDGARARNALVIVVAHRHSVLQKVDHIIVMANGRISQIGSRDDIMKTLTADKPIQAEEKPKIQVVN